MIDPLYRAFHRLGSHNIRDATETALIAGNRARLRHLVHLRRDYEAEMSPLALRLVDVSIVSTVQSLRRLHKDDIARVLLENVRPVRVRIAR